MHGKQKALITIVAVLAICFAALFAVGLYTIDRVVTRGEAYGFEIGDSREEVFQTILSSDSTYSSLYVLPRAAEPNRFSLDSLVFGDLAASDTWTLTMAPGDSRGNMLRLYFENGELREIYRSRRIPLELP